MSQQNEIMRQVLEEARFYVDASNPEDVYVEYPRPAKGYYFDRIQSKRFKAFLREEYRHISSSNGAPDFEPFLSRICDELLYEGGNQIKLNRRLTGTLADGVVYNLCDEVGRKIMVTKTEWKPVLHTRAKFIQPKSDLEQVMPERGGNYLRLLRPYINLNDEDFKLLAVCLVQFLSRSSSHFAIVVSSPKGTGKSTLTRLMQELIDPSIASTALVPSGVEELKNNLANRYLATYDNTEPLKEAFSNVFCAAITGAKAAKRKLYTNYDEVILSLHNVVILNGIGVIPEKSDLAERSLLFSLQPITEEQRRPEQDFWAAFEKDKPLIFGAMLTALSNAMAIYPTLEVKKLHRMADAHKEMLAIALALGIEPEEFNRILKSNCERMASSFRVVDPFIKGMATYVREGQEITGTTADIFEDIHESVEGSESFLPMNAAAFGKKLCQSKAALERYGIQVNTSKTSNNSTMLSLKLIPRSRLSKEQQENMERLAADAGS